MRRLSGCIGMVIGLVSQLSCSDATGLDLAGTAYTLASVNGVPLPFVLRTIESGDTPHELRLVARSLTLIDGDSVQYAEMVDVVNILPDGTREATGVQSCFSARGTYNLLWNRIAVKVDTRVESSVLPTVRYDTLAIAGDSLIQGKTEERMIFRAVAPSEPICDTPALE